MKNQEQRSIAINIKQKKANIELITKVFVSVDLYI